MSKDIFNLLFAVLLVYGVMAKRAPHLIPFFCIMVFEFFTLIFSFVSRNNRTMDHCTVIAYYDNNQNLRTAFHITYNILSLAISFHVIRVIWSCYQYLTIIHMQATMDVDDEISRFRSATNRLFNQLFLRREPTNDSIATSNFVPPGSPNLLQRKPMFGALPNYEDALKISSEIAAPPPYVGTANMINEHESTSQPTPPSFDEALHQTPGSALNVPPPTYSQPPGSSQDQHLNDSNPR
ncbi:vacuolar fusion protein ccz1 [Cichlidogyrus casuarinus]|uniref:Vacuolar fusion protein ccz1 n=1 Tax=Cichlidogyrus casuarinus TaxID=1844966 RepID=A0ABD2QA40_9PLAT